MKRTELEHLLHPDQNYGINWRQAISQRVLDSMTGRRVTLEDPVTKEQETYLEGSFLWAPGFNWLRAHSALVGTQAGEKLGKALSESGDPHYSNLNPDLLTLAGWMHDDGKVRNRGGFPDNPGKGRLSIEAKNALGLAPDFDELHDQADELDGIRLQHFGFPREVIFALTDHDFPTTIPDGDPQPLPYWQIIIAADYESDQTKITPVAERLFGEGGIRERWIDNPMAAGKEPKVPIARFNRAAQIISQVTTHLYEVIGQKEEIFLTENYPDPQNIPNTGFQQFLEATIDDRQAAYAFFPKEMIRGR